MSSSTTFGCFDSVLSIFNIGCEEAKSIIGNDENENPNLLNHVQIRKEKPITREEIVNRKVNIQRSERNQELMDSYRNDPKNAERRFRTLDNQNYENYLQNIRLQRAYPSHYFPGLDMSEYIPEKRYTVRLIPSFNGPYRKKSRLRKGLSAICRAGSSFGEGLVELATDKESYIGVALDCL